MYTKVPAISGKQLIRLLQKDGWNIARKSNHGIALTKSFADRTRVTVVPSTRASLDTGTLAAILGPKQTGIAKTGLLELINKYGL
ncbi:MAG: type II toxin-antitoxin system HicA family toxin [Chloroflexota bacterium]|nr:type II toxin-antitoxin system HicA family toxin [Chloroflexota bacterium]